jgi:hypothetical protein
MKKLITDYVFDAAARTVTLPGLVAPRIEGVLLVTNLASNEIIYSFADPAKGGAVAGNVLQLDFNTGTMLPGDPLQIFYDDGSSPAQEATLELLQEVTSYLKLMLLQIRPLSTQDTNQRQRVVVEGSPNVTGTVNIGNTVRVESSYSEITPRQENSRIAFANGIRRNLTF